MSFLDKLTILEDAIADLPTDDICGNALGSYTAYEEAKRTLSQAKSDLVGSISRINSGLAMAIKMAMPSISLSIDEGTVTAKYFSRELTFRPNVVTRMWEVTSSGLHSAQFQKALMKQKPPLALSNDFGSLAASVVKIFRIYYQSLGESASGVGTVIIEGKVGTISDLAALYKKG